MKPLYILLKVMWLWLF